MTAEDIKMGKSTNNLVTEPKGTDYGQANKLPQYIAALSVCMGSVAAGTVLGWTANISDSLKKGDLNDIRVTDDDLGWIGSFMALGAMLMCFPIGLICDLIGRKLAMLLTIIPFSVGWLLVIFANGIEMIYVGRFLTGMAGGAFCVSAPMYTSEIAQTEIRGALGSYFQLLLTVGILFAYIVGKFCDPQVLAIICACVPLVFGVVFFLQPETPVYSLKKNDEKAALAALKRLRGPNYNSEAEMADLKVQLANEQAVKISFRESFRKQATKRSLIICFGLMLFQQLSGINAVIFYTDTIFKSAGSSLASADATILVGCMQVAATFVSSLIIDRFGRKILLLISDIFIAISALLLGIFFTLKDRDVISHDDVQSIGFLPILSLCLYVVMFSIGFGPIPWMISAELMPAEIKSNASSAAGTFNWFLAFLVTKFYLNLNEAIGGDSTFYIFAAISTLGTVFVFFCVPETKGKTLEEIQVMLNGGQAAPTTSTNRGVDNEAYTY